MKPMLPLALFLAGITAAVLAGPAISPETAAPATPAGPALPALVDGSVTFGRDAAGSDFARPPLPGPAAGPWPPGVPPLPAEGAADGPSATLSRLQAIPAASPVSLVALADGGDAAMIASMPARLEPVPEPSVWMMMLSGFALVGLGARRRRRARAYLATL